MGLNFVNLGRTFFGLLAELVCNIKPLGRKYKVSRRLRGPWPKGPFLWLHGASMGECKMLLNLADALRNDIPNLPRVLLTTQKVEVLEHLRAEAFLKSADGLTSKSVEGRIAFALAPADTPWTMKKFLRRAKPVGLILGENELWPGYLSAMQRFTRSPSVALVSGRFKNAIPGMDFSGLGFAAMQTTSDQNRFLKFSAKSFRAPICVGGDWKLLPWAREWKSCEQADIGCCADSSGTDELPEKSVALVSVHIEELPFLETLIRSALAQKKSVVLVPRRLEEVAQFRRGLKKMGAQVGDWPLVQKGTVSLVNQFGVVSQVLSRSDAAVVGGSFHNKLGIHDFWEPLRSGVVTFVGPYCRGHESAVDALVSRGALVRLKKSDKLGCIPADRTCAVSALSQEREKILNSYSLLKMFVEELRWKK